jgi:hypothetical protein
MTATFDTSEGRIEVALAGDGTGTAYFFGQDFETAVDRDGSFCDWYGRRYTVIWPRHPHKQEVASLEVWSPRTIGRVVLA